MVGFVIQKNHQRLRISFGEMSWGVCVLSSSKGVKGTVRFFDSGNETLIFGKVEGLAPGSFSSFLFVFFCFLERERNEMTFKTYEVFFTYFFHKENMGSIFMSLEIKPMGV